MQNNQYHDRKPSIEGHSHTHVQNNKQIHTTIKKIKEVGFRRILKKTGPNSFSQVARVKLA